MFHDKIRFYIEELLAPCPTHKLEHHPLLAVCCCLFSIFTATLHIGGRSSIRNLRMCHAVVTGSHLSRDCRILCHINLHMRNNVIILCKSASYILFSSGKLFPNFFLYHIVGVTCLAVGGIPISSSYEALFKSILIPVYSELRLAVLTTKDHGMTETNFQNLISMRYMQF